MKKLTNLSKKVPGLWIIPLFIVLLLAVACSSRDDDVPPTNARPDIYIGGSAPNSTGILTPSVWKNGAQTLYHLAPGLSSGAISDLAFSNGHLYGAGGVQENTTTSAAVWTDGTMNLQAKQSSTDSSLAYEIYVAGTDVYAAGYEIIAGESRGIIWKNNQIFHIFPASDASTITRLAVAGSDLCAVGFNSSSQFAFFRFSGSAPTKYLQPDLDEINDLTVSGNDIYLCGQKNNVARYLKNGTIVNLPGTNAKASAILINDNNIYVGGIANSQPALWKNGTLSSMEGTFEIAPVQLMVALDDVYASGSLFANAPFYWKNGKKITVPNSGSATSVAHN